MKKLLLPAILLFGCAVQLPAQLSLSDRALLRRDRLEQRGLINSSNPHKAAPMAAPAHRSLAMIRLADGYSRAELEAEGVTVSSVRGSIALVSIPTDDVERIAALPAVATLQLSRPVKPTMGSARLSAGIAKIHDGEDLDQPYTGRDVIVGIVDGGIDPNHINFRNEDGSSRVGYLGHCYRDASSRDGWSGVQYDRDNIWRFTTDTEETFHGTHTMGILAGSYRGPINAAVKNNSQISTVQTIDNPYYGVATEADIAAGCGDLVDFLIAQNIDQILNYRYYYNKPAVISLSLGSTTGSHSSESLMAQYLDEVAKEAIVVLSAGNEGDIPLALIKNLTEDDTYARSFIQPTYLPNTRYGQVYFYSDSPFKMKAVVYNRSRHRESYPMPVADGQGQGVPQYYAAVAEEDGDIVSPQFATAFEKGYVGVGWDIDDNSGQYMCMMDYYTEDNTVTNANGNYILGFVVEGTPGQRIECYCDGTFTALSDFDEDGWDDGSTDGTISDMACGKDVLVVGAYNTADDYPAIDGIVHGYQGQFTPGKVTPFSSYGTLADGRTLPHVCAPGAVIVSSTSSYYTESAVNGVGNNSICATLAEDDRTNYWCPAMGTSMATPLVAGSIALWLQADPTLDINDVKEIIAATAVRDDEVLAGNPVQWGAGKFDAYAGLKEVLRRSGVTDASADASGLMMSRQGDLLSLFLAGAKTIDAVVYNLSGMAVLKASAAADELSLDASSLAPGVYIVCVNGNISRKITIK